MSFTPKKFYVAGVQHHRLHKVINEVAEGSYLTLQPEPTNQYDPNAVKVIYGNLAHEEMVGYVPKKISSEVAAALEIGTRLVCEVISVVPSAKPWEQLQVEIREDEWVYDEVEGLDNGEELEGINE